MLCGLWSDSDADASDEDGAVEDVATESDAAVELAGTAVLCRVSSYHPFNANRVWPGTYSFADWLAERWDDMPLGGRVLELGAATGALSAWLTLRGAAATTTDIDDDGVVASRVAKTFALNGLLAAHHPHTWGDPVPRALLEPPFPLVVAVDILLYTKAYPALITTLQALLEPRGGVKPRLLMNWERRFKGADDAFFDNLAAAGLTCAHLGRRVFDVTATAARLEPVVAPARGGR